MGHHVYTEYIPVHCYVAGGRSIMGYSSRNKVTGETVKAVITDASEREVGSYVRWPEK